MIKKTNPIQRPLMELFGKLNHLNGLVFVACSQLKNATKVAERAIFDKGHGDLIGAGASLVIRDLTEWPENGYARHYPSGGFQRRGRKYIKTTDETERVLATFAFAQAYEAFETFLLETTARYLYKHPLEARSSHRDKFGRCNQSAGLSTRQLAYWRGFVRFSYRGRDNAKIMNILRRLSQELREGEKKNNRGMDLCRWYSAASSARHAATHSWGELKDNSDKVIPKTDQKYFRTETSRGRRFLQLYYKQTKECLTTFAEYGFLIFKCLSLRLPGYELYEPQNRNYLDNPNLR